MDKAKFFKFFLSVFFLVILSSCATSSKSPKLKCTANIIESNGRPCWVNVHPKTGIVVNMAKHVRPEKTREILFNAALAELSVAQNGVGVAQDAVVKKVVEEYNDNYSGRTSMTSLSVITTAKESTEVKARVEAVWNDYATQKLYMWVVLEGH